MPLQPAIYRREDQTAGYDILFPATEDPLGPWLKLNLAQPYFDNGTLASCKSYGALAVGQIMAGYAHPGKIGTLKNGLLAKTSGTWAAYTTNLGRASGHYTEYTVSTGGQVSYVLPAGHNLIAVTLYVATNVKQKIDVALAGSTLEVISYGTVSQERIDTKTYTVAASAADRTLTITAGGDVSKTLTPIAVRSWKTSELADPRAGAGGTRVGNSSIEYTVWSRAAVSTGKMIHAANTFAADNWRIVKPSTFEPIIRCDPDGGGAPAKWTALGHPHYSASDLAYVAVGTPALYIDGALVTADMLGTDIPFGQMYQADSIVVVQQGTTAGDVLKLFYVHSITRDGISTIATFVFQAGALVQAVYGTSLSGTYDEDGGLAEIVHAVEIPGDPTQYASNVAAKIRNGIVDVVTPGCPVLLQVTNVGPAAYTQIFAGITKVYSNFSLIGTTPAAGVPWSFASHVKPHLRKTPAILPAGVRPL